MGMVSWCRRNDCRWPSSWTVSELGSHQCKCLFVCISPFFLLEKQYHWWRKDILNHCFESTIKLTGEYLDMLVTYVRNMAIVSFLSHYLCLYYWWWCFFMEYSSLQSLRVIRSDLQYLGWKEFVRFERRLSVFMRISTIDEKGGNLVSSKLSLMYSIYKELFFFFTNLNAGTTATSTMTLMERC